MFYTIGSKYMIEYKKILLATDGSENNQSAVYHCIALAKAVGAEVTVVSVVELTGLVPAPIVTKAGIEKASMEAEKLATDITNNTVEKCKSAGVKANSMILLGVPATEIINASKDYDLIVMGTLGRTGFNHLILGSVAERVIKFSSCPVFVVRSNNE